MTERSVIILTSKFPQLTHSPLNPLRTSYRHARLTTSHHTTRGKGEYNHLPAANKQKMPQKAAQGFSWSTGGVDRVWAMAIVRVRVRFRV